MLIDNEKKELIDNVLTSAFSGISNQWINMVVVRGGTPTEDTIAEALIKKQPIEFQVIQESRKGDVILQQALFGEYRYA